MKRLKIYLFIISVLMTQVAFADNFQPPSFNNPQFSRPRMDKEAFAKRLGLTEEQKQTLDKQRQQDMQEIKPILEEMFAKRNEFESVMTSNMPQIEKEAKLLKLKSEMKDLKSKADEKRSQNMKRFESVLTEEQRNEFQKIKAEGRQRQMHPDFPQKRPQ